MSTSGRARFLSIMAHESDHSGFWHGDPNHASIHTINAHFHVEDDFALGLMLRSDCRWVMPEKFGVWPHKAPMFDVLGGVARHSLGQDGFFADCEDVAEVEAFPWPDPADCDFTDTLKEIDRTIEAGQAVLSGMWSCFFHVVADFFGMENYFIKMYTDPDVVLAVTNHVTDFYLRANERLFALAKDRIDAFFFGNDFGSQRDLLVSPEFFDRFVMPSFVKFTEQAHRHGYRSLLHSCGAIERVIPRLLDAGVDALHPIQARAANMDAETLAKKYRDRAVFVGGLDTQHLLPFGTPAQVKEEVRRLRELFGPNFILSPSHESILPNVPMANIEAMAEAAAL